MSGWMLLLSDLAAGTVRVLVGLLLLFHLLQTEKPGRKSLAAACAGALIINSAVFLLKMPDICRGALETVWIVLCAVQARKADVRMSLFVGIYYEITVFLWQFLFGAAAGLLFGSADFLNRGTKSGQMAVGLFYGGLVFLIWYLFRRLSMTGNKGFRLASGAAVAGLLAVITLSEQNVLGIEENLLDMWTILAAVVIMSVQVFHSRRQYEMEKELAALNARQAELLERDYQTLNRAYAVNAKLFHDFHNHLGVIRQLLSRKKYEETMQYLNELHTPVQEMRNAVWTGDETVDYLINEKKARAKAKGIQLQAQVEFPRHTNIRGADLCAVLGNLLDNALEAAGQVAEPEQRLICLTIRRIHQMVVIKVENSFEVPPATEGKLLKTTKEDNGLHGWGLKSIQAAAEKYDGMVQTSYTDQIFRTVVTLGYEGVATE